MNAIDIQAEQHRDRMLRLAVVVDCLVEAHKLVECCGDHTWLKPDDIENLAYECGARSEYLHALTHPQT